jgi:hypothetical protein
MGELPIQYNALPGMEACHTSACGLVMLLGVVMKVEEKPCSMVRDWAVHVSGSYVYGLLVGVCLPHVKVLVHACWYVVTLYGGVNMPRRS